MRKITTFMIFLLTVVPAWCELEPLEQCRVNVKNIGNAIAMYQLDHDGNAPKSLADLLPNYLRAVPTCPTAGADTYSQEFASSGNTFRVQCSGEYHPELKPNMPFYTHEKLNLASPFRDAASQNLILDNSNWKAGRAISVNAREFKFTRKLKGATMVISSFRTGDKLKEITVGVRGSLERGGWEPGEASSDTFPGVFEDELVERDLIHYKKPGQAGVLATFKYYGVGHFIWTEWPEDASFDHRAEALRVVRSTRFEPDTTKSR